MQGHKEWDPALTRVMRMNALSESQLRQLSKQTPLLTFNAFLAAPSRAVLGKKRAAVLHIPTSADQLLGHWVALIERGPDTIELFDSLANNPRTIFKQLDGQQSGHTGDELLNKLRELGYRNVITTKQKFQNQKDLSCGFWVILRLGLRNKPLHVFRDFVNKHARNWGITPLDLAMANAIGRTHSKEQAKKLVTGGGEDDDNSSKKRKGQGKKHKKKRYKEFWMYEGTKDPTPKTKAQLEGEVYKEYQQEGRIPGPAGWNTITSPAPLQKAYVDLMDMQRVATKKGNKGMRFILLGTDIYSRFAWALPLKNKTSTQCATAMRIMYEDQGFRPVQIICDSGGEFKGEFATFLREKKIRKHAVDAGNHQQMGVNDRVCRSLRTIMRRIWVQNNNLVWVPYLPTILKEYNNRKNRETKHSPQDILLRYPKIQNEKPINRVGFPLSVGQRVRKLLKKKTFEKGGRTWSKKIYKIIGIKGYKYMLNDNDDGELYMPRELKPTDISKRDVAELEKKDETTEIEPLSPTEVKEEKKDLRDMLRAATRERKRDLELKRLDVDQSNVLEGKRTRKRRTFYGGSRGMQRFLKIQNAG